MNILRGLSAIKLAVVLLLSSSLLPSVAFADKTTKEEVMAKVQEAAMLIADKGQEAAFKEINNKEGRFVWGGGTYLTVMDFEGTFLARGDRQKAIGKNLMNWQDKSNPPKYPMKEMIDLAKTKGEGWVEYLYPKPGPDFDHAAPSKKIAYAYKVPGHNILVTAGFYE